MQHSNLARNKLALKYEANIGYKYQEYTKGEFHIFKKCYFEKWVSVCKMARLKGSFAQHYVFKMAKIGSLSCSINFHKLKHEW